MADFIYEICLLPRPQALTFSDYLNLKGISAQAKASSGALWVVCVSSSDDVYKAKLEFAQYVQEPFAKKYTDASWKLGKRVKAQKEIKSRLFNTLSWDPFSLTSIIEIICVVFFIGQMLFERQMLELFSLTQFIHLNETCNLYILFTPCFLHFGITHIAFNLVMGEALARPIERYFGKKRLFALVVGVAILSNILQLVFLEPNTIFGGLSGVVYGVIGYAGVLSLQKRLALNLVPPGLLAVSAIFIVLGFLMADGISNFCHLGGLLTGMLLGFYDYTHIDKIVKK